MASLASSRHADSTEIRPNLCEARNRFLQRFKAPRVSCRVFHWKGPIGVFDLGL